MTPATITPFPMWPVEHIRRDLDRWQAFTAQQIREADRLDVIFPLYLTLKGMESVVRDLTTLAMNRCVALEKQP